MLFDNFVKEVHSWWSTYFHFISREQLKGNLDSGGGKVLYPNILLVTNCSGHYVAELVGATEKFVSLLVKRHKEDSVYRYLSQFDDCEPDLPLMHLEGNCSCLSSLCLAHEVDFEEIKIRFQHIELYRTRLMQPGGGGGSILVFGENFISCMIDNCILVNRKENLGSVLN